MDNVMKCLKFRFFESLLSYQAFFTLILAEGALILRDKPENMLMLFVLLGAYYLVIVTFSLLNGLSESTKKSHLFNSIYVCIFLAVFTFGCVVNYRYATMLTVTLISISFVNDKIRFCQRFRYESEEHPFLTALSQTFETRFFYVISQSLLVFDTVVLLGYFWLFNGEINLLVRIGTFFAYCVLIPIFGIFEKNSEDAERYEAANLEALERYRREARYRNYDD